VKLFLPQTTLEKWATTDKADLSDGKLVVKESGSSHPVMPAVYFHKLVSGEDSLGLLGRVKTLAQLTEIGAEQLANSCIVGETAYEVAEGYVTIVAPTAAPSRGDARKKSSSPEADLLAAFILEKL
jgi:hypothetical protein